jgi:hypothetical protein
MAALPPIGAHKGYGLALLVGTHSGVLSGAGVTHGVLNFTLFPDNPSQTGHTSNTPIAAAAERIYLPGEIEIEHEAAALMWHSLVAVATKFDCLDRLEEATLS